MPEGRFVLDIYNRKFFEDRLEAREFVKEGVTVTEQKTMVDDRLILSVVTMYHHIRLVPRRLRGTQ
jgi:hypothetical protein